MIFQRLQLVCQLTRSISNSKLRRKCWHTFMIQRRIEPLGRYYLKLSQQTKTMFLPGLLSLALLIMAACTTTKPLETPPVKSSLPPPQILLGAGDQIEIKFPYHPELNETVSIRPDGKIALQMVDEVNAANITPEQLDNILTKLYAREIRTPSLTVIVRRLAQQRVFVGGQVARPGIVPIDGQLSVLEAILQAGGPHREHGSVSNVVVVRNVEGKRYSTLVNLKPAFKGKPYSPFLLAPNDIVLVPQTTISSINQWVDQYINKIMPATYLRIQVRHGDTLIGYGR